MEVPHPLYEQLRKEEIFFGTSNRNYKPEVTFLFIEERDSNGSFVKYHYLGSTPCHDLVEEIGHDIREKHWQGVKYLNNLRGKADEI